MAVDVMILIKNIPYSPFSALSAGIVRRYDFSPYLLALNPIYPLFSESDEPMSAGFISSH